MKTCVLVDNIIQSNGMGLSDKIAVIGHNGWAAKRIIEGIAAQPFEQSIRILAREGSDIKDLPKNVEVARYTWDDQPGLAKSLEGVDILMYVTIP